VKGGGGVCGGESWREVRERGMRGCARKCVAVCCSVLQCVPVQTQCVPVCCNERHLRQCVVVCCSVLQCAVECCIAFHCVVVRAISNNVLQQRVAVCCSASQMSCCVAVHCSVLQSRCRILENTLLQ